MGKTKGNNTSIMGIKVVPLSGVIGAYKYIKSDWTMVAFVIPRSALKQDITEKELQYNGIYFLMGRDGITDKAYVGQAKKRNGGGSILVRLREHNDSKTEAYRDIWNYAVVVTSGNDDWGPTELNALENIFYNEIDSKNRLNGNEPNSGGYGDEVDYQEKVRQTKAFFKFSNMNVFKDVEQSEEIHMLEVEMPENYIMEDLQKGMSNIPEILTPIKVVKEMVDMLPAEVFNPDTRFLDMVCKGGEFLKEIYNRLMEAETMVALFPDPIMRAMHILDKQLFGVALSQESQDRANRNLYGYAEAKKNIKRIKNYISAVKGRNIGKKEDGSYITIEDLLKEEFGEDMEFNVVIGNPPYSEESGGGGRTARQGATLYHRFIEKGIEIADIVCMITKNNWLSSDTLKDIRNKMINTGIVEINNYPIYGEIFKGISVSVSSFLIKHNFHGETKYREIKNGTIESEYSLNMDGMACIPDCKQLAGILRKVKAEWYFDKLVYSKMPFGIASDGKIGATGKGDYINMSLVKDEYYNTPILFNDGYGFMHDKDIPKNANIRMNYKIACGQQLRHDEKVIYNIKLIDSGSITSQSFAILFDSDDKTEVVNVYKYMHTKFARILVRSITDEICTTSPIRFKVLPVLDFTDSSDIDWSQSIPDIDKQLYAKYGLSQEEVDYIESTIKQM